jgi:hypothetical protein
MNDLAEGLRQAVLQLDFPTTADAWQGGQPVVLMPSIDLAVVHFAPGKAPRWANVLFSREHPWAWSPRSARWRQPAQCALRRGPA